MPGERLLAAAAAVEACGWTVSRATHSERLAERRVREAAGTGADVLVVCCPYEFQVQPMLQSRQVTMTFRVCDIIELIDEADADRDRRWLRRCV